MKIWQKATFSPSGDHLGNAMDASAESPLILITAVSLFTLLK
jgi:hypothetical protein